MTVLIRPLLLCLAFAVSADALAQSGSRQREQRRSEAADTVRRVERETGGEVLRTDRIQRDGREVYRVKVLTPEGRVRVMQDDPRARRDEQDRARAEERNEANERRREREDRAARSDEPANY